MSIHVNVGGQNKKTSNAWMKINGEWKKGAFWNNVQGTWKKHSSNRFEFFWSSKWNSATTQSLHSVDTYGTDLVQQTSVSLPNQIGSLRYDVIANPYHNTLMRFGSTGSTMYVREYDKLGNLVFSAQWTSPATYVIYLISEYTILLSKSLGLLTYFYLVDYRTGVVLTSNTITGEERLGRDGMYLALNSNRTKLIRMCQRIKDDTTGDGFTVNQYLQVIDLNTLALLKGLTVASGNEYTEPNYRSFTVNEDDTITVVPNNSSTRLIYAPLKIYDMDLNDITPTNLPTVPVGDRLCFLNKNRGFVLTKPYSTAGTAYSDFAIINKDGSSVKLENQDSRWFSPYLTAEQYFDNKLLLSTNSTSTTQQAVIIDLDKLSIDATNISLNSSSGLLSNAGHMYMHKELF